MYFKKNLLKHLALTSISFFLLSCGSAPKVPKVNTQYSEYSPSISADGRTMIFQSDFFEREKFKIVIKHKKGDDWTEPVLLNNVNSDFLDGGCFITYDQNHLIITSNRKGGIGSTDLWISNREGDNWTRPKNFGEPVNSDEYEGFASLSPDGKTIYFVRIDETKSECKTKKFTIYYSEKVRGEWLEPKRMPHPVGTEHCEFGPVILADGITLLFSSTRPGGFGDYDIYKTEKKKDGTWSDPVNLGDFINTPFEDSLVSIPASGDIMYYTKSIEEGSEISRIYSVPIPEELQQKKVITVFGVVRDARKPSKLLSAIITIVDSKRGGKKKIIFSNKKDGKYIAILNKGSIYDFSVKKRDYAFYSTKIDLRKLKKYEEIRKDIMLNPLRKGARFVLNNLQFKYNSFKLLKSSKYELIRIINMMEDNPKMIIELGGHTDNVGSSSYNIKLSKKRATSVVKYLLKYGADKKRIRARGYGKNKPLASNDTEEGREKNRRVEIKIIKVK